METQEAFEGFEDVCHESLGVVVRKGDLDVVFVADAAAVAVELIVIVHYAIMEGDDCAGGISDVFGGADVGWVDGAVASEEGI